MTEEEFIEAYCIWCDVENYDNTSWTEIVMPMKNALQDGV